MNLEKYAGYTAAQIADEIDRHVEMLKNPDPMTDGGFGNRFVMDSLKELVVVGTIMALRNKVLN